MEFLTGISTATGISVQTLFVVFSGATVFCLGIVITSVFFNASDPLQRRLKSAVGEDMPPVVGEKKKTSRDFMGLINPVAKYILPQDSDEASRMKMNLIHAGFRSEKALPYFYGIKVALALFLPLLAFVATRLAPQWTMGAVLFVVIFAAFIGISVPNGVVERIKEKRLKKLRNAFPDALDLLVVCVEAGLGLGAAIDRVSRDLEVSHPELADELRLVNVEMRAGIERPKALKNLADRSGLADIRGLVGLLVQTIRFGTSVADALRVYSEEFRDKRMQQAEEQAAKIGTKLIFPLVACLFPAFFVVAVGPAALRMMVVFRTL
jgi:tight adherence protein C